jgi:Flp pilus assembly protein TadD
MDNLKVESLCQQARQAVKNGDPEQARKFYAEALALQPESTDALYGLGTVSFMANDLLSAIKYFQEVLLYDPRRAAVHINLGAIYNRLGQLDKAIESLRRGIQYDPHRWEGFYNLGVAYKSKREFNLSIQAYREAIRLNPRMADAHLNLANLLAEREDFTAARSHYRQALELLPNWEAALGGLTRLEEMEKASKPPAGADSAIPQGRAKPEGHAFEGDNDAADHERLVNPNVHGALLTSLHRTTIETEGQAVKFVQALAEEIEPVIKELSSCLLVHGGVNLAIDLDECLTKLDTALEDLTSLHDSIESNLDQIREQGDQLLRS